MMISTQSDDSIVFVVEIPLTDANNVITYNVCKTGEGKVAAVNSRLFAAVHSVFSGIEGVKVTCRRNPDWHEIVRQRNAPKRPGFFQRLFRSERAA